MIPQCGPGPLDLSPVPTCSFIGPGRRFVLLDGSWAGQWPVTLSRPTRLWECADTVPRTLTKLHLLNPPQRRGRGGLREWPKNTLVHRLNLVTMGSRRLSFFLSYKNASQILCMSAVLFALVYTTPTNNHIKTFTTLGHQKKELTANWM